MTIFWGEAFEIEVFGEFLRMRVFLGSVRVVYRRKELIGGVSGYKVLKSLFKG